MAKRRKTLEQKKVADMRHQVYSLDNYSPMQIVKKEVPVTTGTTSISSISYLRNDILKTTILTAAILSFQVLLFLLLKNHVVAVPLVSY